MIDVSLSVRSEDAPLEWVEQWETILPPWAGIAFNGVDAVKAAVEAYFDTVTWDEWFGLEDYSDANVIVTVHSPESIAGDYSVRLERETKAYAKRLG